MDMKNYDPKKVVVTADGTYLTGFAEGTFVNCEKDEENHEVHVGAQGEISRTIRANDMGTITVTLKSTSPSNEVMSGLAKRKKSVFPFYVRDENDTTKLVAGGSEAWVERQAPQERGGQVTNIEWTVKVSDYSQEN